MKRIVTIGVSLTDEERNELGRFGEIIESTSPSSVEDFLEKVEYADVIYSNGDFLLESLDSLENVFVVYPFVEIGCFNSEKLASKNVFVANSRGGNKNSIVEWTMYMILSLFRDFRHKVRAEEDFDFRLDESLEGKEVLIVGKGSIGEKVGSLCESFSMKVDYFCRGDDLMSKSNSVDLVINALNCNSSSENLLNEAFFKNLKKGCYFVTFARAFTYDVEALIESIEGGVVKGAAVDCDPEAYGDTNNKYYKKLLAVDNILVTPHVAFATSKASFNGRKIAIDNIKAYLDGDPINVLTK